MFLKSSILVIMQSCFLLVIVKSLPILLGDPLSKGKDICLLANGNKQRGLNIK